MKQLVVVVLLAACGGEPSSDPPPVAHHEDRHDPAIAAPALSLAVTLDGRAATWGPDVFERTPHFASKNHDGQDRDTWSLRELAHGARVTAVIGERRLAISEAEWDDATRTPIVHRTRRGGLKFRWADAAGAWGDVGVKDVTGLEIQSR